MGRKHIKHDVEEALNLEQSLHPLELRNDEGIYPFSPVWRWTPQNGKRRGETVSLTIDSRSDSAKELIEEGNNGRRFFYSEYQSQYGWAVEALGQGLKTMCLEGRCSHAEASYTRNAVGSFFEYCRHNNVRLDTFKDFSFQLMCAWRNDLRFVEMNSRYKANVFRRFSRVVERVMGTSLFPVKFTMPVYTSDDPDPLAPYSDAVMYQLIGACVSDIETIMEAAKGFKQLGDTVFVPETELYAKGADWRRIVRAYFESCSFRGGYVPDTHPESDGRAKLTSIASRVSSVSAVEVGKFTEAVKLICTETTSDGVDAHKRLTEKEVATRGSLFPFLLFFLICSGKNKEVVMSWQRMYRIGKTSVSPLDWKDPLDPTKCRVRGYKSRGKGRGKIEADDTYIKISEDGMYPIFKFLMWYTKPLVSLVGERSKDSLWLYFGKRGVNDCSITDRFLQSAQAFLDRHEIWDVHVGANGEVSNRRLASLDSRRFRKVYAAKEMMKAINEAQSHQELAASLTHALKHKQFDTTLGSYLSLGTPKTITDIGIFTLQENYLEEARKFRGVRKEHADVEGLPGFYAACANPQAPDYEGAAASGGKVCQEYDMCLGCTQSRVFDAHLPRIAKRILQYEAQRETMPREGWEAAFGRKLARAQDVLNGWSDMAAVNDAWDAAENNSVFLPEIICRG
ncbi:hypothetical protein [Pseudomonas germanica]|uniref:hypothetical protein n=1 Tax=Pseudomonas germanica TaxID=2815720 RepID=UPI002A4E23CD|nr:hypothetical protein [Pseudomonas germanica]WPN73655.1 hypothetical protein QMK46_23205 [Pseudomonas germanica]